MGSYSKRLHPPENEDVVRSAKRRTLEDEDQSNAASEENDGSDDENGSNADPDDQQEEDEDTRVFSRDHAVSAGVIKRVYVENFMCHRKFTIDFCRNVNFITGQNGSGKSAILAALQICLGSGARTTHRAGNLKDLIRKDGASNQPTEAIIRVSLMNEGTDAFEAARYGKTITVERTITRNGGFNGFKLLNDEGVEVSRKKKDLHTMLDYLYVRVVCYVTAQTYSNLFNELLWY